jgi:hypothetical protein
VPQDERRLQRHECTAVLGNEPRSVISHGTSGRDLGGICVPILRADKATATIHGGSEGSAPVLPFCIQLHTYGIGIEIVKKDLNLEYVLPFFSFKCGGAESKR